MGSPSTNKLADILSVSPLDANKAIAGRITSNHKGDGYSHDVQCEIPIHAKTSSVELYMVKGMCTEACLDPPPFLTQAAMDDEVGHEGS